MSQFGALIWLKWRLFRNALRSRKAAVGRAASALGTLAALTLAVLFATGLGFATYFLTSPRNGSDVASRFDEAELAGFLFLLSIFAFVYLLWAIIPLGVGGGGSQFDPARLLLYPISFRKLFVVDWLSELTSLASIFAVPAVVAVSFAAGLAGGKIARGLVAGLGALAFGLAFAKLLSTSIGALLRRRRSRGETVLALLGAAAGLAGAFFGQLAPYLVRQHAEALRGMRWTPPGAVAVALTAGLGDGGGGAYAAALLTLAAYTAVFILLTYRVMRRSALGAGGAKRAASPRAEKAPAPGSYAGWSLPLLSAPLSAVVEKEWRYATRNAPLRMLALMPLILIGVRFMQRGGEEVGRGTELAGATGSVGAAFAEYGEGAIPAAGVLYVFMVLSSISCNLFAFEEGGMRAFILSPLSRRTILVGKNIVTTGLALVYALLLVAVNQLVFRDLTAQAALFTALCFVVFAALSALFGNWLSIHFPKRMQFGKRLNASGVTGLLLIPIMVVMTLPPLLSVVAGYVTRSPPVKYATLALCAAVAVAVYALLIGTQGRSLARREHEILDAVSGRSDN